MPGELLLPRKPPSSTSRSTLRAPYDFDRQNNHGMECEYFRSFRYFEPDIQPGAIIAHADRGPGPDLRVRVDDDVIEVVQLEQVLQLPREAAGRGWHRR